jgi:hypothetical protein
MRHQPRAQWCALPHAYIPIKHRGASSSRNLIIAARRSRFSHLIVSDLVIAHS